MYEKLRACHKQVDFYKVLNGGHGVGIWSKEAMSIVKRFFRAYL